MRKPKCFLLGMSGAIVVLAAAAVLVPLYCDNAARVALAESLRQLAPYRDTIAENASKEGSVEGSGVEGAIPSEAFPGLNVDYARVFPDGTIVIRHAKHSQVVIWEPSMTAGQISWRCVGGPPKDVPPECR
jgi:hypothetical protein